MASDGSTLFQSEHQYQRSASGASGGTILVFTATFVYLAFFSGTSPGLIGGVIFYVVGMFAVSILISMPLFLLRLRLPILAPLFWIADIAVTIFLTRLVYLWIFAQPSATAGAFVVECQEPLPVFTLGIGANPSESEVQSLCTCIWGKLNVSERQLSRLIVEGRETDISDTDLQVFTTRFGDLMRECGGADL